MSLIGAHRRDLDPCSQSGGALGRGRVEAEAILNWTGQWY